MDKVPPMHPPWVCPWRLLSKQHRCGRTLIVYTGQGSRNESLAATRVEDVGRGRPSTSTTLAALTPQQVFPEQTTAKCGSLFFQGHTGYTMGWSKRPSFPNQREVAATSRAGFLDESKTKLEWLPISGIVGDNVFLEKSAAERARISNVQMKTVRKIRRNLWFFV